MKIKSLMRISLRPKVKLISWDFLLHVLHRYKQDTQNDSGATSNFIKLRIKDTHWLGNLRFNFLSVYSKYRATYSIECYKKVRRKYKEEIVR